MYQARGLLQLKYLISHIRQKDELGKSMVCVLEQTQLYAGVSSPILTNPNAEDTPRLQYVPTCWITTIRDFLKTFDGSIEFQEAWKPTAQRQYDTI